MLVKGQTPNPARVPILAGDRRDSNPRSSGPHPDALSQAKLRPPCSDLAVVHLADDPLALVDVLALPVIAVPALRLLLSALVPSSRPVDGRHERTLGLGSRCVGHLTHR